MVVSTRTAEFVALLLSFTICPLLCGLLFVLSLSVLLVVDNETIPNASDATISGMTDIM